MPFESPPATAWQEPPSDRSWKSARPTPAVQVTIEPRSLHCTRRGFDRRSVNTRKKFTTAIEPAFGGEPARSANSVELPSVKACGTVLTWTAITVSLNCANCQLDWLVSGE